MIASSPKHPTVDTKAHSPSATFDVTNTTTLQQGMIDLSDKDSDVPKCPDAIPVDLHMSEYDHESEHDDNDTSFTLASTLHDFSFEHGRRYPSYRYGSNPFPLDELSVRNEKILHHMMLCLLDNKHFLSPVTDPKTVLDVRCAQGSWAEDMADLFPDAEIVAMDTTSRERSTFPNVSFLVQSIHEEWILDQPGMKFDFIFARNVFAATGDFAQFYKQAFENTAPDGHFEHIEMEIIPLCEDGSARPESMIQKLCSMVQEFSEKFGVEYHIAGKMAGLSAEAGFVDLVETRFKLPLGPWSADPKMKQLGEWFEAFYKTGLQGWCLAVMTRYMGYTPEQVNEMCEQAFKEVDANDQHYYFEAVIVHGRKPA